MTNDEVIRILAQERTHLNATRLMMQGLEYKILIANDSKALIDQSKDIAGYLSGIVFTLNELIKNLGGRP